jgi:hypothetical protein
MKDEQSYSTYDLPLATTLVVLGYPIKKYQRSPETRRVSFVFQQSKELEANVELFWEGQTHRQNLKNY